MAQILALRPEMAPLPEAVELAASVLFAALEQTLALAQAARLFATAAADNDNPALHWPHR
ncbi:MAG TPA: hypothetical protein DDW45_04085 [Gammaproteobacteria bacterium]|nr:hypothetical protein [Gammaproteobacteria bacterium]